MSLRKWNVKDANQAAAGMTSFHNLKRKSKPICFTRLIMTFDFGYGVSKQIFSQLFHQIRLHLKHGKKQKPRLLHICATQS
jgi:hypothetical protein